MPDKRKIIKQLNLDTSGPGANVELPETEKEEDKTLKMR